jgi:pimeloyl-ACP methyl ester carboxylesterase/heme-degrading monooxygenase HmoA
MDHLSENGYDVYALDFLGYGGSDRYTEMTKPMAGEPLGRASEIYLDVDKAVDFILLKTGKEKVYLVAHSWGGAVAATYATKFPEKVGKLVLFAPITIREGGKPSTETVNNRYEEMTPAQRIDAMKQLTPPSEQCQLAPEVFDSWGNLWLKSDPLATKFKKDSVRFPSGYALDIDDLAHGKRVYDPSLIKAPVLLIRGEWDRYPNNADAGNLFAALVNASTKKYVVVEKATHVMHLEKSRYQLYEETLRFLRSSNGATVEKSHPIAVIFEVIPKDGRKDEYLGIAASLKPELEKIEGFISIERFQSIYHPEKILSLSFWKNEEAIKEWRNLETHRAAQSKGREFIFKDYHLRISQLIRDYGMFDRKEAPVDSRDYHK